MHSCTRAARAGYRLSLKPAANVQPRYLRAAISCLLIVAMSAGCGSQGAATQDPTDPDGDRAAFCDQSEQLDALQRPPNDSELDRLLDAAPSDIKNDVETLAASARQFRAGNEEAASSDEIQAAGDRYDAYVEENCDDA